METLKIYLPRILIAVLLVGGWIALDKSGVFGSKLEASGGRAIQPRVLSGRSGMSASTRFIPVEDAQKIMSPDVLGIFLKGGTGKFYPLDVIKDSFVEGTFEVIMLQTFKDRAPEGEVLVKE